LHAVRNSKRCQNYSETQKPIKMENRTIQAVQNVEAWNGQHGQMFEFTLALDDGRIGRVNAKTNDRWNVGDVVVVTSEKQTKHGLKWSMDKAEFHSNAPAAQATNSSAKQEDRTAQIEASWAITNAVRMGATSSNEQILQTAQNLLNLKAQLVEHMQNVTTSAETAQGSNQSAQAVGQDGLPF